VGILIAIVIVVVVLAVVGVALGLRRRSRIAQEPTAPPRPPRPEPAPMTGLEDALAQVTDRSGTSMRDRLDAESDHVEQFRVTNDTGPLLRRALDQVGPSSPAPRDGTDPAAGDAGRDDSPSG
jgi:hypothetical protein